MVEQEQGAAPAPAARVHPHPIRWDAEAQLWVCTQGCGFSRPKREAEVVPSREEALQEARRAGTGADFADLGGRTTRTAPDGAAAPPPDAAGDTTEAGTTGSAGSAGSATDSADGTTGRPA